MALLKRKTRKMIRKEIKKALNKHGAKIATGLASGLLSTLATYASTDDGGKTIKKAKKELARFGKKSGVGKALAAVPALKTLADRIPALNGNEERKSAKRTKKQAKA